MKYFRKCPCCNKRLSYTQKWSRDDAIRKDRVCIQCLGALKTERAKTRKCSIVGCDNQHCSNNYCRKHNLRNYRYGSPHTKKNMRGETMETKFWAYTDKAGRNDCWLWTASTDGAGYGMISNGKSRIKGVGGSDKAHRFSWELHNKRKIPKGMVVMHTCDNPPCVNPNHLMMGTVRDNVLDAIAKGRHPLENLVSFGR